MTSRRLGRILLALAAVWSLAGLDWPTDSPSVTSIDAWGVTPAYAGDPDDVAGSNGPAEPPPPPPEEEQEAPKSLWETIVDAIGSLLGD